MCVLIGLIPETTCKETSQLNKTMESAPKEYVVRNALCYAYDALRSNERYIGESTTSRYENYFQQLAEKLAAPGKKCDVSISNSEVESFYLGRVSLGEFRLNTQKR